MIVSIKDSLKQAIIMIMAACAVFISTLFLNYNIDLAKIGDQVVGEQAQAVYEGQKMTSVVVSASSGGCLLITTVIMLAFFVKNYIDTHKKELGILKALGYSNLKIAKDFWVFGLNILIGAAIGFCSSFVLMGKFYETQNEDGLLPDVPMHFNPILLICLVWLPAILFAIISVLYASLKLRRPALELITDNLASSKKSKKRKENSNNRSFISNSLRGTLRNHKGLAFFMFFGSFCFSAMAQMSFGVRDAASPMMSYMLLVIGLVLAFVSLFLAISTIVKNNSKTTAMMKVFGYSDMACRKAVLEGYRPMAYVGFAFGTFYQYFLMKLCFALVFKNMDEIPEYNFDLPVMFIALAIFVVAYELFMVFGLHKIKKTSVKEVMLES